MRKPGFYAIYRNQEKRYEFIARELDRAEIASSTDPDSRALAFFVGLPALGFYALSVLMWRAARIGLRKSIGGLRILLRSQRA